jgi:hypothetical protein
VGLGQSSGGPALQCSGFPYVGGQLCVTFPSPLNNGFVLLSLGACSIPPIPLTFPFLCAPINLFVNPAALFSFAANGNPANLCLPIPANPSLANAALCLQSLAQGSVSCYNASNGLHVRLLAD